MWNSQSVKHTHTLPPHTHTHTDTHMLMHSQGTLIRGLMSSRFSLSDRASHSHMLTEQGPGSNVNQMLQDRNAVRHHNIDLCTCTSTSRARDGHMVSQCGSDWCLLPQYYKVFSREVHLNAQCSLTYTKSIENKEKTEIFVILSSLENKFNSTNGNYIYIVLCYKSSPVTLSF